MSHRKSTTIDSAMWTPRPSKHAAVPAYPSRAGETLKGLVLRPECFPVDCESGLARAALHGALPDWASNSWTGPACEERKTGGGTNEKPERSYRGSDVRRERRVCSRSMWGRFERADRLEPRRREWSPGGGQLIRASDREPAQRVDRVEEPFCSEFVGRRALRQGAGVADGSAQSRTAVALEPSGPIEV